MRSCRTRSPFGSGWLSATAALLVVTVVATARAEMKFPKLSATVRSRLDAGEILTKVREVQPYSATAARAMGVVAAPPAQVWKHIDACGRYKEFLPRIKDSEEISRKGEWIVCRTVASLPFPIGDVETKMKGRHQSFDGDRYRRQWKAIEGPYHVNMGSWQLFPWPKGKTLIVYTIKIALKKKVPGGIQRAAQRITLPKVIKSLRERVRRDPAPDGNGGRPDEPIR